jgi:hypothetical protein
MGFDEIFEQSNRHDKYRGNRSYGQDDYNQSSGIHSEHNDIKDMILRKLRDNPKLKGWLIAASVLIITLVVILVILLFPSIMKLFGFIGENGIKGLIDSIWSGSNK